MRQDMYHCIREAGRNRPWGRISRVGRAVFDNEGELLTATRESMRRPYRTRRGNCKSPEIRTAPLRRFIASRVGQPWNDVYSELCHSLRRRNAVLTHPLDYVSVETQTRIIDGQVQYCTRYYGFRPIEQTFNDFYVHPETGLLCRVPRAPTPKQQAHARRPVTIRARRREIDEYTQLHKVDGSWYEVQLQRLPSFKEYLKAVEGLDQSERADCERALAPTDVLTGRSSFAGNPRLQELYGRKDVCGVVQRALSYRELREYGLLET